MLAVHLMLGHIIDLDGAEGAQSDMERHISDVHSFCTDPIQQFIREMQSRCRSGGRAEFMRIDRLVALLILELCGDVGGQRHLTDLIEGSIDVFLTLQLDDPVAVLDDIDDLRL